MGNVIAIKRRRQTTDRQVPNAGARFGRLVVLQRGEDRFHGEQRKRFPTWLCRCDCGAEREILDNALRMGRSNSCGCFRREKNSERLSKMNGAGPKNPRWKGGRQTTKFGYVEVWLPEAHPMFGMARSRTGAGGYVYEHRLVVAEYLGRPLRDDETVHHMNGERTDNRLENLQLRMGQHGSGAAFRCADCGSCNIISERLGG